MKNKNILITTIIALLTALITAILVTITTKVNIEITDFSMNSKVSDYTYIDNTITYSGEGIVSINNKKSTYIILIEKKLVSGGDIQNASIDKEIDAVIVTNGIGKFYTYDSGDVTNMTKPVYEFKILGYIKMKGA